MYAFTVYPANANSPPFPTKEMVLHTDISHQPFFLRNYFIDTAHSPFCQTPLPTHHPHDLTDTAHPPSQSPRAPAPTYPRSQAASLYCIAAPPGSRSRTPRSAPRRSRPPDSSPGRTRSRCTWSCRCRTASCAATRRPAPPPRSLWPRPDRSPRTACRLCSVPRRSGSAAARARPGTVARSALSRRGSRSCS